MSATVPETLLPMDIEIAKLAMQWIAANSARERANEVTKAEIKHAVSCAYAIADEVAAQHKVRIEAWRAGVAAPTSLKTR